MLNFNGHSESRSTRRTAPSREGSMKSMRTLWIIGIAAVLVLPCAVQAQVFTVGPGLALNIPDNTYNGTQGTMICNTIAVPSGGGGGDTVDDLRVTLRMSHTFVGDLTIKLI